MMQPGGTSLVCVYILMHHKIYCLLKLHDQSSKAGAICCHLFGNPVCWTRRCGWWWLLQFGNLFIFFKMGIYVEVCL